MQFDNIFHQSYAFSYAEINALTCLYLQKQKNDWHAAGSEWKCVFSNKDYMGKGGISCPHEGC